MAGELVTTEVTIEGRKVRVQVEPTPRLPPWGRTAHVGRPLPRTDGVAKVTGAARYTVDVRLPGALVGAILRSPHARARVRHLDMTPALAIPGVVGVLGPSDVAGITLDGEPVLTMEPTRVGREIACVVAVDRPTARAALAAIHAGYEVEAPSLDWRAALARGEFTGGGFDETGSPTVPSSPTTRPRARCAPRATSTGPSPWSRRSTS